MKYGWTCTTPQGSTVELGNVVDSDPPMVELIVIEPDDWVDQEEGVASAHIPEDKLQAMARHILGLQPYQQAGYSITTKGGGQMTKRPAAPWLWRRWVWRSDEYNWKLWWRWLRSRFAREGSQDG